MPPLSVQDAQLPSNDRVTLGKLLKLGLATGGTPYTMTAADLGANGLSTNALVALARVNVAAIKDEAGTELRPKTTVARQVTVYGTGAADFILALDLGA